jgi:tetratricopeptide (TPR) repeat protein
MRTGLAVLATWALLATAARAQGPDKEKLRAAAQLPSVSFKVNFLATDGLFPDEPHPNVPAKIAKLEKEMCGDATDAERYERLGDLYAEVRDSARCRAAYDKAVPLYRQQAADRPKDGRVLRHLADVLPAEQADEREALLRRAVGICPSDWECWRALQDCLIIQAAAALNGGKLDRSKVFDFTDLLVPAAEGKIGRARAERADRLFKEALHCADQAIRAAPQEARAYANRANCNYCCRPIKAAIGLALGDASAADVPFFTPSIIEDLRAAVKLDPANNRVYRFLFFADAMNELQGLDPERQPPGKLAGLADLLSPATQKLLRDVLARHDAVARSPNPRAAADAAEFTGAMRLFFLGDVTRAEADLRQAIRLDPARDDAWDMLTQLLLDKEERKRDLLAVATERVKQADTLRNRLILAEVYAWDERMDKAEETLTVVLQREPENAEAALGLVAAALHRGDDTSLSQAQARLGRAEQLVKRAGRPDLRAEYGITKAIYLGLTGRRAEAESTILDVLIQDASNKWAGVVLEALRQEQGTVLSPPPALPGK